MDSRAQFEAWFNSEMYLSLEEVEKSNPAVVSFIFEAWQASRASIEVELPEKISKHNTNESGYIAGQAAMYDEGIDDCAEAISARGISIKGEVK